MSLVQFRDAAPFKKTPFIRSLFCVSELKSGVKIYASYISYSVFCFEKSRMKLSPLLFFLNLLCKWRGKGCGVCLRKFLKEIFEVTHAQIYCEVFSLMRS